MSQPSSPAGQAMSLEEKYKKLVEAYKKIKQQNGLLKQAVIQGREQLQQKSKQEEDNQASVKEIEMKLRSATEENALLKFHNNRLTKKVDALQNKLTEQEQQANEGYGWFSSGAKAELLQKKKELQVAMAELAVKISENEQLHIKNFEDKKEYQATVDLLEQKIKALKLTVQQQKDTMLDENNEHSRVVVKLTEERDMLLSKSQYLEETLLKTQNVSRERELAMGQVQQKLDEDLTKANQLIKRKIFFDDSSNETFNKANIPNFDRKKELKKIDTVNAGLELFRHLISNYSDYFSAFHERLLLMNKSTTISDELRNIHRKIIVIIPSHTKFLSAIHKTMADLLSDFSKPKYYPTLDPEKSKEVVKSLQKFVLFNKKLLTYELLRLDAESRQPNYEPSMKARNDLLCDTYSTFHSILEKLDTYVALALLPDDGPKTRVSRHNQLHIMKQIVGCISSLNEVAKTFYEQMSSKIAQEHKDPFVLPALKQVNERLLQHQSGIVVFFGKIQAVFETFFGILSAPPRHHVRGSRVITQPGIHTLEKRSRDYLQFLNRIKPAESIPYAEALNNRKMVAEFEGKVRLYNEEIKQLCEQKDGLTKEKLRLQSELALSKDALAQKQAHHNSLLAELAATRQQLEKVAKGGAWERPLLPSNPPLPGATEPAGEEATGDDVFAAFFKPTKPSQETEKEEPIAMSATSTETSSSLLISFEGEDNSREKGSEPFIPVVPVSTPASLIDDGIPVPHLSTSLLDMSFPGPEGHERKPEETPTEKESAYTLVVMDETGGSSKSFGLSNEDREREQAIKKFFETKIEQLMGQLKEADHKAVKFHKEYTKSLKSLEKTVEEKKVIQAKMVAAQEELKKTKEELELTRSNYEAQMKIFSEHIVTLNEKLLQQEDTISLLKKQTASGYPTATIAVRKNK